MVSDVPLPPVIQDERGRTQLRSALARRGLTEALYQGLAAPNWSLNLVEVSPLPRAFRMMVNHREFHVTEMALTTLAMAIDHGRPLVGLPVVLSRDFHYRSLVVRANSNILEPQDLLGGRVGVRAYSQTTGVWVRGLLADEFSVDPRQITWVTFESAHVEEYVDPPHVERAAPGANLLDMLAAGELDAAVIMDPHVDSAIARPMFPDADDLARNSFRKTGIFPVNHVVAVDTELLEAMPTLAEELVALFQQSKDMYVRRLDREGPQDEADRHALALAAMTGGDVSAYGLEPNRLSCERLIGHAQSQGLLTRELSVEEMFCA